MLNISLSLSLFLLEGKVIKTPKESWQVGEGIKMIRLQNPLSSEDGTKDLGQSDPSACWAGFFDGLEDCCFWLG